MKTETQIAKENIKIYKAGEKVIQISVEILEEHKATCQRFLEFLKGYEMNMPHYYLQARKEKITDLKQAIKLYGDNRI